MGFYLIEGSYTTDAIANMIAMPDDRVSAVKALVEGAGGKLHHMFFTFGETDFVVICELPDDKATMALALAASAPGHLRSLRTRPLMTADDARAAMDMASMLHIATPLDLDDMDDMEEEDEDASHEAHDDDEGDEEDADEEAADDESAEETMPDHHEGDAEKAPAHA